MMRPKRRDSSYQRAMLAAAGTPRASPFASRMRALPRTTMVVRTPHERSRSSALANSRRKRTPLHGIAENEIRIRCRQAIGGRKLLKVVIGHWTPPISQNGVTSSPRSLRLRCDGGHKKALYRAAGTAALWWALRPWTASGHRSIDRPVCRNGLFLWSVLAADRFDRTAARAGSPGG